MQDKTVMNTFLKAYVTEFDTAQISSLIIQLLGMSTAVETDMCECVI
jgi:hypothetical protein